MERTRKELADWGIEHGGMMLREIQESDPRMVSPEVRALAEFAVEVAVVLAAMPPEGAEPVALGIYEVSGEPEVDGALAALEAIQRSLIEECRGFIRSLFDTLPSNPSAREAWAQAGAEKLAQRILKQPPNLATPAEGEPEPPEAPTQDPEYDSEKDGPFFTPDGSGVSFEYIQLLRTEGGVSGSLVRWIREQRATPAEGEPRG